MYRWYHSTERTTVPRDIHSPRASFAERDNSYLWRYRSEMLTSRSSVAVSRKWCPIRQTSVIKQRRRVEINTKNQAEQKIKEGFSLKVSHNKRGVVCKSAVLECFRWAGETWILMEVFFSPQMLFFSTLFWPCFMNLVSQLTPWGCVCFHYKGEWTETWGCTQTTDKIPTNPLVPALMDTSDIIPRTGEETHWMCSS